MTPELICPVTKVGLHRKRPWQRVKADVGGPPSSGLSCNACFKTWTWRGDVLVPTYQENSHGG